SGETLGLLDRLPVELLSKIIFALPNADIKNLRLTCTFLGDIALPRLSRIFISTNPQDIEIFTLIADHDVFRFKVTEIIYDDSRFDQDYDTPHDVYMEGDEGDIGDVTGVPDWFRMVYSYIVNDIDSDEHWFAPHVKEALKTRCTPVESYEVFRKMKREQDEVVASGWDADALKYGLSRFPNLRKLTLSPAAHGIHGRLFYPTPTLRSLCPGLILPLGRGWPVTFIEEDRILRPWNGRNVLDQEEKRKWRGFCVVTKQLAQHIRENPMSDVSEFVVESRQLWTAISCRVFDNPEYDEYQDLVTILSHPRLRRLELSLGCGGQARENWCSFRRGFLYKVLSMATHLERFSFYTTIPVLRKPWQGFENNEANWVSLRTLFPISKWSCLRHYSLSRLFVKQADVMEFMSALPPTLEVLEFSFLVFIRNEGDYNSLLRDMRDNLGWRERPAGNRPNLVVLVNASYSERAGVVTDVSPAVEDFVYRWGSNPFPEGKWIGVLPGKGTLVDFLDPICKELN
ncbi:hypothetical protein IL306_004023, partial [Fusarium sp. DS 682]